MANIKGGLVAYKGGCHTCGKEWGSKNVMGLMVQHADRHRHETWVELTNAFSISPGAGRLVTRKAPQSERLL